MYRIYLYIYCVYTHTYTCTYTPITHIWRERMNECASMYQLTYMSAKRRNDYQNNKYKNFGWKRNFLGLLSLLKSWGFDWMGWRGTTYSEEEINSMWGLDRRGRRWEKRGRLVRNMTVKSFKNRHFRYLTYLCICGCSNIRILQNL